MTKIIMTKIEKDSFSLVGFYIDRGRRIIPALAFLCFVLLIFGWFYLISYDYRQLGMHVASSLGFLSNIIYWIQAGYFDMASHEKWLLHTWSLSVEWQFYILYPILIIALHKFIAVKSMKTILVLLTIVSLIFSIIISSTDSSAAFYLLPTRAWEMLIGGLVFYIPLLHQINKKCILKDSDCY
jgi:peptidoglycan/LPS O-acetylase OafA/YrhL